VLIQVILIAAVVVVTVMLTRSTANARHQAIRRLLLAGFVVAAVLAIIFPGVLSALARLVGVGRGSDLLLYALVIAFVSYIATSHRRSNQLSRKITLLTRELSLAEARIAEVDETVDRLEDTAPPTARD
jgi:small membrane protein